MMAAYLISVLTRRFMLKPGDFPARYSNEWLVWEPGGWSEPKTPDMVMAETQLPESSRPVTPVGDDPLCFELKAKDLRLTVGRAPTNHIVLNDMRVSRNQFELLHDGAGWTIKPIEGAKNLVFGKPVPAAGLMLASDTKIQAGGIQLSFYGAADFARRLEAEAQKFKR